MITALIWWFALWQWSLIWPLGRMDRSRQNNNKRYMNIRRRSNIKGTKINWLSLIFREFSFFKYFWQLIQLIIGNVEFVELKKKDMIIRKECSACHVNVTKWGYRLRCIQFQGHEDQSAQHKDVTKMNHRNFIRDFCRKNSLHIVSLYHSIIIPRHRYTTVSL